MKNKKRIQLLGMAMLCLLGMSACKGKTVEETSIQQETVSQDKITYGAKYLELPEELGSMSLREAVTVDDMMYCIVEPKEEEEELAPNRVRKYQMTENGLVPTDFELVIPKDEENSCFISDMGVNLEGEIYVLLAKAPKAQSMNEAEDTNMSYEIAHFDANGEFVNKVEIAQNLIPKDAYIDTLFVDQEGYIGVACKEVIFVFDSSLDSCGDLNIDADYILAAGCSKEASYIIYYQKNMSVELAKLNLKMKKVESSNSISASCYGKLDFDKEGKTYIYDMSKLVAYQPSSGEEETLLNWNDLDILGEQVVKVVPVSENKYLVFVDDWNSNHQEMLLVSEVDPNTVVAKEEIKIALLYDDTELRNKVVKYNKTHEDQKLVVEPYIDFNNWTENSYEDAISRINADMLSDNPPDIICLEGLNLKNLAEQGLIEDLTPYIEASNVLSSDAFFGKILDCMTYEGKLVSIPYSFRLDTLIGRTEDVGSVDWGISDAIDFIKAHPEQKLIDMQHREYMSRIFLSGGFDEFIDKETGECHFDSPDFIKLMEYLKGLETFHFEQYEYETPIFDIQDKKILMYETSLGSFYDPQMMKAIFGNDEITYKGFPGVKGNGTLLELYSTYSISAKSKQKEKAWDFLEFFMTQESDTDFMNGFPCNKHIFEVEKEKALNAEVALDEEGNPILDDNGEKKLENASIFAYGGNNGAEWTYENRLVKAEEVELIEKLVEDAVVSEELDADIMNILSEEIEAYFENQKSLQEVCDIMANRISLYIKENR